MKHIYLDNNATTALDPVVRDVMLDCMDRCYGNPSSLHVFGQEARRVVDRARAQAARLIGAVPEEIIFTGSGTEANNLALFGVMNAIGSQRRRLVTSVFEHQAVLNPCHRLEEQGFIVAYAPVDRDGMLDPDEVATLTDNETALISIMMANNDIGVTTPISAVATVAKSCGALVHTDAVQAVGKMPVNVQDLGVSLLSFSAHKLHGPKGIGALFVKRGTPIQPLLVGGHQEYSLRAGTENVPAIAGFGEACELAAVRLEGDATAVQGLRDRFEARVLELIDGVVINGRESPRLVNTSNISFTDLDGELLVINLDLLGIAASTGAACSSTDHEPSHVLLAMGRSAAEARSSVRFSFGRDNTIEEIDRAVEILQRAVALLKKQG